MFEAKPDLAALSDVKEDHVRDTPYKTAWEKVKETGSSYEE